ncbi:MAG: SGNH/GDSL hydrolase family protein [Williamsia sp.]|nr:SGNH/GDSL hydrolase family protein [Williamsia sp.]
MKKLLLLFFVLALRPQPKELAWTALGDSITYLNDHRNETGNRITKGYMTLVTERLPNLHFINQGHNGWTVVRIAKEIDQLGLEKSDVYTVFLGTNDWWHEEPLGTLQDYTNQTGNKTVCGSYRMIINKLRSLNKDAQIILITPMQRSDFVYINNAHNNAWGSYKDKAGQSLSRFAAAIKEIGKKEHFTVIDLYNTKPLSVEHLVKFKRLKDPQTGNYKNFPYPAYTTIPFNPDLDEYPYPVEAIDMTYDGLHPSDKGYEVIADALVKVMKKL